MQSFGIVIIEAVVAVIVFVVMIVQGVDVFIFPIYKPSKVMKLQTISLRIGLFPKGTAGNGYGIFVWVFGVGENISVRDMGTAKFQSFSFG